MRLAVMQPYFLPYIGYFQLIASVDKFVILDDVSFINRGWINRNRLSVNGVAHWMSLPLIKASQNRLIREIDIQPDNGWKGKMLRRVKAAYQTAPQFDAGFEFVERILAHANGSLSSFLGNSLAAACGTLGITTSIVPTSSVYPKSGFRGQERILDLCQRERATTYVNLPGGRELYDRDVFTGAGISLRFIKANFNEMPLVSTYSEGPILSILDLLMTNPLEAIRESLTKYSFSK